MERYIITRLNSVLAYLNSSLFRMLSCGFPFKPILPQNLPTVSFAI
jgi:hypothetical protein